MFAVNVKCHPNFVHNLVFSHPIVEQILRYGKFCSVCKLDCKMSKVQTLLDLYFFNGSEGIPCIVLISLHHEVTFGCAVPFYFFRDKQRGIWGSLEKGDVTTVFGSKRWTIYTSSETEDIVNETTEASDGGFDSVHDRINRGNKWFEKFRHQLGNDIDQLEKQYLHKLPNFKQNTGSLICGDARIKHLY